MEFRDRERLGVREPYEGVSTPELLVRFVRDAIRLFRKETELAKAELGEMVRDQVARIQGFVTAAVLGLLGTGVLAAGLVLLLAEAMAPWLAAFLVGAVLVGAAAMAANAAKNKRIHKPLEKTRESVKEDVEWIREKIA